MNTKQWKYRFAALIGVGLMGWSLSGQAAGSGQRSVSADGTVRIEIDPPANAGAWAVEETIGVGLTLSEINAEGQFDSGGGVIRWGPFFSASSRTLSYVVRGRDGTHPLRGAVSFNGETIVIGGDGMIRLGGGTTANTADPVRSIEGNQITIRVVPPSGTGAWAIEESLPDSLTAVGVNEDGQFDRGAGVVRWGPFFSASTRTLSYRAEGMPGTHSVQGVASFDGDGVAVVGESVVTLVGEDDEEDDIRPNQPQVQVVRSIVGGQVTIAVDPTSLTGAWALEEQLPLGVQVEGITEGGSYDSGQGVLRWGPFFSSSSAILNYEIVNPVGDHTVRGTASFDGVGVAVTGPQLVRVPAPNIVKPPMGAPMVERLIDGTMVSLRIVPPSGTGAWALEEVMGGGLTASGISGDGQFDRSTGKVRWGPFFDDSSRSFEYRVDGAAGRYSLQGVASFDGGQVVIGGDDQLVIGEQPGVGGVLQFSNLSGGRFRPILDSRGQPLDAGRVRVELLAGNAPDALVAVAETEILGMGLFSGGAVAVPTVGNSVWVQVRAWDLDSGSSFEQAAITGASSVFMVTFSPSVGGLPALPSELVGFESFALSGSAVAERFASSQVVRNSSGNGLMLQWDSELGRNYIIETSHDLTVWSPAFGPLSGSGQVEQFPIVISGSGSAGFFRVRVDG